MNKEDWGNTLRKKSWEGIYFYVVINPINTELQLTVEADDNKSVQEKIYLPFQPSYFILSFFFSICREIHRIGSHVVDKVHKFIHNRSLHTLVGSSIFNS